MNAPDWWTLIAREKHGMPEGWRWNKLQAIGIGKLPREKCISEVTGCTYGPEVFKSGPRKGKPKPNKATEQVLYVTFADLDAFCLEWEMKTGKCHNCGGDGLQLARVSVASGVETTTCHRCGGDGKARP